MAVSSGDVPGKYDLILTFGATSYGFVFSNTVDQSLPFRVQRADYTYSPTFIQRTNVQGDYGDNQQDFYLTFTQRDWSLGERQQYFRADATAARRYYQATAADIRIPGKVTQRQAVRSFSPAAAASVCCAVDNSTVAYATSTNLYYIDHTGTVTDKGAHGLGATPTSIASVAGTIWLSSEAGGSVGVRKYDGAVYTTWSASTATELEYLNNALYGIASNLLVTYDTAGTRSTVFTWKKPDGAALSPNTAKIRPLGGKLLIMLNYASGTELWIYDGTAPSLLMKLPVNFYGARIEVVHGIAFVSGVNVVKDDNTNRFDTPAIYFYNSGTVGLLWQADGPVSVTSATSQQGRSPVMCAFDSGLVFTDETTGRFMFYDITNGGVHAIGDYTVDAGGNPPYMAACQRHFIHTRSITTAYQYPNASAVATSSTVKTSLADFDSSLTKYIKSVKVEADIPTGATVDVAYQLDALTGSYTNAQTGLTSGTEYTIGQNGHSISVKVTLNKGSSSAGPTLKRISVKAAPILTTFRNDQMILDCSGRDGKNMVPLRDGSKHPKDGMEQVADIRSAIAQTSPITVTDRFGTFTAVVLPDQTEIIEIRPEEFVVKFAVREV